MFAKIHSARIHVYVCKNKNNTISVYQTNILDHDFTDSKSDLDSFDTPSNSCPSDECWSFDGTKCVIKPGCTSLTCDATKMSVGIITDVFGSSEPSSELTEKTVVIDSASHSGYGLDCKLGDCGMTVENDGTNLVFRLPVTLSDTIIDLGDTDTVFYRRLYWSLSVEKC